MRDVTTPAAILAADGVEFVVVGSAALMLHGHAVAPHDLDVVPSPAPANVALLAAAIKALATRPAEVPTSLRLRTLETVRVATGWGPLDLLLALGRAEFDSLYDQGASVQVGGVTVRVASVPATTRLQQRFRGVA